LSFSYHKSNFKSKLVQFVCYILGIFYIKRTVTFVCSNRVLNRTSKRLKQNLFFVCDSESILDFLVFCKKQNRFTNFIKSKLFTCNIQSIFCIIKEIRVCIRFKLKIITTSYNISEQVTVFKSMNTFNIRISSKHQRSACNNSDFSSFCKFCYCSSHSNNTSKSSINFDCNRLFFFFLFHFLVVFTV